MTNKFTKMHGAGNDFVMIDDRDEKFPDADVGALKKLGTRRLGVGCEGIILVRKTQLPDCDFAMRFFNPDGSEADLCGNGARCVAAFAREIGAAKADSMKFETRAGVVEAEILTPRALVKIGMPPCKDQKGDFVVAGVPHKIEVVKELAKVDVDGEGRRIRYSEAFAPAGTNVDFVEILNENELNIRTYERGVEAESGACGTGSVASAVIGVANYGMKFPVKVHTSAGYELIIGNNPLTLTGPVEWVYQGEIEI